MVSEWRASGAMAFGGLVLSLIVSVSCEIGTESTDGGSLEPEAAASAEPKIPRSEIEARLRTIVERLQRNKWVSNENLRKAMEAGKLNFGEDTETIVQQQLNAYSKEVLEAEKLEAEKLIAEQAELLSMLKEMEIDK